MLYVPRMANVGRTVLRMTDGLSEKLRAYVAFQDCCFCRSLHIELFQSDGGDPANAAHTNLDRIHKRR